MANMSSSALCLSTLRTLLIQADAPFQVVETLQVEWSRSVDWPSLEATYGRCTLTYHTQGLDRGKLIGNMDMAVVKICEGGSYYLKLWETLTVQGCDLYRSAQLECVDWQGSCHGK